MNSVNIKTKVCIVGAGPAGTTTSIFLSRMGIDHIMVDAAEFPRDKICGDGLDIKTVRMLNHIDPDIIPNEILHNPEFTPSWGFRLLLDNKKMMDFGRFPSTKEQQLEPPLFIAKRKMFDQFLQGKLNNNFVQFFQGTKVTELIRTGNNWKILAKRNDGTEMIIDANMIVGADGDHSVVLKNVGERKINRMHYAGALRQYWKGIGNMHPDNLIEIYFPKKYPMSYFWIFPQNNGEANVGYGMTSKIAADKSFNIREIFDSLLKTDPSLAERFAKATPLEDIKGWGIPFASLNRQASGDGWLLVGDAASMVIPTTGEGIGTGMMTGYIAAHFIERAVKQNCYDHTMFTNYTREIQRRVTDDVKLYKRLMSVSPHAMSFIMNNVVNNKLFRMYFENNLKKWIHTAYHKKVEISL